MRIYSFLQRIRKNKKRRRLSPQERERVLFEKKAKEQFQRLKEKGLGIRVYVL